MINTTDTAGTPTLLRTLGLRSLVLFGLAYMTPMIVLGIFGVVAAETAGASASAYLIALVAMLFTASSYGRMAAAYPVSGSAYTYVRRSIDSRVGFLTGWAVLLDYLFLPMVIWLIGAAYLEAQFPGGARLAVDHRVHSGDHGAQRGGDQGRGQGELRADGISAARPRPVRRAVGRPRHVRQRCWRTGEFVAVHRRRRHRRRSHRWCGDRRLLLPRLRRGHHVHRGGGGSAQEHAARDPADRRDRRRHLPRRLLHHTAGASGRGIRRRVLGGARDRQVDRRQPVRRRCSWPAW